MPKKNVIVSGKVICIEDDRAVRQVICSGLRESGFNVLEAEDGKAGIVLISDHPDVMAVLTDTQMPRADGFEVLRYVRDNRPGTKVLMMSGLLPCEEHFEADAFLQKPICRISMITGKIFELCGA